MIVDDHKGTRYEPLADASCNIRQDEHPDAQRTKYAGGERHATQIVPFVTMGTSGKRDDHLPGQGSGHEPAFVAAHTRHRPVRHCLVPD